MWNLRDWLKVEISFDSVSQSFTSFCYSKEGMDRLLMDGLLRDYKLKKAVLLWGLEDTGSTSVQAFTSDYILNILGFSFSNFKIQELELCLSILIVCIANMLSRTCDGCEPG